MRKFFRLDNTHATPRLEAMGDSGAFSYVRDFEPPYRSEDLLEFYSECGFDHGVSMDHIILAYEPQLDALSDASDRIDPEYRRRQALTIELAKQFLELHKAERFSFTPIGVAHGWSPRSYANSVSALQKIGYRTIGLGGMVPLKTPEILECLQAISKVRRLETSFHMFGVTRYQEAKAFQQFGVASFDSTSPLLQAFKDAKDNYHTPSGSYMAVRVPQVQGNAKLHRSIVAGKVDQAEALRLETSCLRMLAQYDQEQIDLESVLEVLAEYSKLCDTGKDLTSMYRRTLGDRPWTQCKCEICTKIGLHVVLFRGAERNRRRGFHNLYVLEQNLRAEIPRTSRRGAKDVASLKAEASQAGDINV